MKLRILSDLHIEFYPFSIPPMPDDAQTVLILAGDIGVIHRRTELEAFLRQAAAQFRAVVYVLGNHEFYRGVWPDAQQQIKQWNLPDNLHVLERGCVVIDQVVFAGTTLWTDYDDQDRQVMENAERFLSDYHYIQVRHSKDGLKGGDTEGIPTWLTADHILHEHLQSRAWLAATLARLADTHRRCVLVTHHAVSHRSIHPAYSNDPLNGAFVNNFDALLTQHSPELVVHGHVHNSFDYCLQGEGSATRVVANPRGYTKHDHTQENPLFDPTFTISLGE